MLYVPFMYFLVMFSYFSLLKAIDFNITVAMDGSGNFSTINQAINGAPNNSFYRYAIRIKKGVYKEIVHVPQEKWNITLVGDGIDVTVVSNDRSNGSGYSISNSATLAIDGDGFLAINLTVENISGAKNHQAVALLSNSRESTFYRLAIKGYQDTLYVKSGPQFYRECYIYGTIDFIFGEGPAVFQNCQILARKALKDQSNVVAANGCDQTDNCGFSFHLCTITSDKGLIGLQVPTPTYLGRPWKIYSKTIFMQCNITEVINPKGWLRWNQTFEKTLFYGEFENFGTGAAVANRVKWPGVHSVLTKNIAREFSVSEFIGGNWLVSLGIPYAGGLI